MVQEDSVGGRDCHTAVQGEACFNEVQWAKTVGIRTHPEWYPGLTASSSDREFQQAVHDSEPTKCPQPCREGEEGCHTAVQGEPCYVAVEWAKTIGLSTHPDWYPGLTADSSDAEFQLVVHQAEPLRCPMPCLPDGTTTSAPEPPDVPVGCHDAVEGEPCFREIAWAKNVGIHAHPEWYPGLTPSSSDQEFQQVVHRAEPDKCPPPCIPGGFNCTNSTNSTGNETDPNCGNSTNSTPAEPVVRPWIEGTWTTGYWDCCKPSCSWPGKGNVDSPVRACDTRTGEQLSDENTMSVCDGGTAASCSRYQPFLVNRNLAFGFAAAAVSGKSGLTGDGNCGQCYELQFVRRSHRGGWGGAAPRLVNKTMVVQVTNIGFDVVGEHSFDIQIPGAGQGIFSHGCAAEYPGYSSGDFDCDNRYGGCATEIGCKRLPPVLRPGCKWRYEWYGWLKNRGRTNNPFVKFRRVRCPSEITALSGSTPLDDGEFRPIDPSSYL